MAKDIVQVEIKRIPLDIEAKGLGMVEIADLAASVEKYMAELQEEGEIDTLKQALMAALHFAAKAYLQTQNEGGKRREEESRVNDLIAKLQTALDASQK
ncbi:MAG: cell division protein ZapA [Elusimicrobiales bacterium]|nr:cell division protein ZapA [Elusimicrobiales bacterium]